MATGDSAYATADVQWEERRNREWIAGRLRYPVYDIDVDDTVTVTPITVDGDDVITSVTTHYTVPGSGVTVAMLQRITVCNGSATARAFNLHLVESGGSRTVSNRIWADTLGAGVTAVITGPFFLSPSDTLQSIGTGMSADDIGLRAEVLELATQPAGMTLAHATTNGSGIEGAALTGSSATYYTAPASKKTVVLNLTLCNTDTAARTPTVYVIESGGSVAGKKTVIAQALAAGKSLLFDEPLVLDPGDTIRGLASVTAVVSLRVTAVEFD